MFSGVFSCWRWENALLSAIHRIQLFPRIFKYLPFDYRAKNDIYSYIYWCFTPLTTWTSIDMFIIHTCFGEALFSLMKKKNKKNNNNNKQIMACKPLNAVVCCFKVSFTIKWKKSCRRHSFLAENKKLPHRFTHRLYMCLFFSEDNASDF